MSGDTTTTQQQLPSAQAQLACCPLPRVTIQFCTQCKWMLRAAYFAQELLSTFSLSLGEVALQPSTGGTFIVTIHHSANSSSSSSSPTVVSSKVLWDRKVDGGFPETKELKRRVRDVIEPGRDLGHVDRHHPRPPAGVKVSSSGDGTTTTNKEEQEKHQAGSKVTDGQPKSEAEKTRCEDCS